MGVWSHPFIRRPIDLCLISAVDQPLLQVHSQIDCVCSTRPSGHVLSVTNVCAGHQQQMYGMREKTAIWRNTLHLAGIRHNAFGQHL